MRQIILDTETTGFNPSEGNRIIEIGCVELLNRRLSGNNFHAYLNPERESEEGALRVHGLTTEFLADKPKFAEIAKDLCDYLRGAEVIIHNAPFDIGFLNAEFERVKLPPFTELVDSVIDTLVMAKELYPGKRNSLDALCDRYGVSNAHRTLHGALLDSELLAEVYVAMTRGQDSLMMDLGAGQGDDTAQGSTNLTPLPAVLVLAADEAELKDHEEVLNAIDKGAKGGSLWRLPAPADTGS